MTAPRSVAGGLVARAGALRPRPALALAALAGAVAGLSQAPFDLWPLGLIGFAALYLLFRAAALPRRAFWTGWAGGAGYFAASMFWIVEPFFVDPWRHGWMAPFALVFLAGGLALFWGLAFALARRIAPGGTAAVLGWIGALTLAELARSYVLTGFPWGLIGYVWAASPAALFAAWIGPHGLTLLALCVAAALARLIGPGGAGRFLALAGLVAVGGALVWAAPRGGSLYSDAAIYTAPDAPVVRLIQPNARQDQKWDPDHIMTFWQRQLGYTATATEPGTARPDLIVWPETAIPWLLDDAGGAFAMIAEAAGGVPVVLGLRRLDGPRLLNSAVVLDRQADVTALYDKHHLVPFGEYVPFGDLAARVGIHGLAAGEGDGYSAGPGPELMDLPGIGPALPLICYEAVFPQDVNGAPGRARVLLQLTNDAWFGRFSGPYQHLQQARMRAIEQGLPMIRVANTGVSAMIDAQGRITARIGLNEAGFVDAPLPPAAAPTPYARTGDWPALAAALALLALAATGRRRPTA